MSRVAIVLLSCSDYESLELSLACYMAFTPENVELFILQNCRDSYDSERTLLAARRYENLYPGRIRVIDHIPPGPAFQGILKLLQSDLLQGYDFICKVDDDAFPISHGWLNTLQQTYEEHERAGAGSIGYVTPLINNNCWGFNETLEVLGLTEQYEREVAITHRTGAGTSSVPFVIRDKNVVHTGGWGTVWGYPHLARWIHQHSTLDRDRFVEATAFLSPKAVPSSERYSIGCIFFRKDLWAAISDGSYDDERMLHDYCSTRKLSVICARSVPFIHIAYYTQREENRDLVSRIRTYYQGFLPLPHPISLRNDRLIEIEARLRWVEAFYLKNEGSMWHGTGRVGGLLPEQFVARAIKGLVRESVRRMRTKMLKLGRLLLRW